MNTGVCPWCKSIITRVRVEPIDVYDDSPAAWAGVSYVCPRCSAVLSVSIDPTSLPEDTEGAEE